MAAITDLTESWNNHKFSEVETHLKGYYAKLGSANNLMHAGNEFTFASSGYEGDIYINYRTAGGTNGNITGYNLYNGKGGLLGTVIHTGNISGQSVNYATSAGSVAWTSVSSRPTKVSQFTNDSGYITSAGTSSGAYYLLQTSSGENDATAGVNQFRVYHATGSSTSWNDGYIMAFGWDGGLYQTQIFVDVDPNRGMAIRNRDSSGTWNSWGYFYHSQNCNNTSSSWSCDGLYANGISLNGGPQIKVSSSYLEINSYGNEMVVGNAYTGYSDNTMYINYRKSSAYNTVGEWYLMAGSSSSWANMTLGNLTAKGGVTALSDIRHKKVLGDTPITVNDIANMQSVLFKWTDDSHDDKTYAGSIAQDWESVLPEVVNKEKNEEGTLSLNYGVAALVSSITTARKVVDLEERINKLEEKVL